MKTKNVFLVAIIAISVTLFSCEQEDLIVNDFIESIEESSLLDKKKPNSESGLSKGTYTITSQSTDPLYQFTIKGKSIALISNPQVSNWGNDYYGYWSDSFRLNGNKVEYTIGLSTTIYEFNPQSNGSVQVIKTLIVRPYQSNGETTTTITTVGNFIK